MDDKQEEKIEIVKLSTGETINKFCMTQFNNLILNTETVWDILDVVTKLSRLDVIKDEMGIVIDVKLIIPSINEDVVLFALKNFMEHQSLRESDGLSAETTLELRRNKLKKTIEGRR